MYQPFIIENAHKIVDVLIESNFFEENELDNTDYAVSYLCEKINKKYIDNNLLSKDIRFTNEEFTVFLKEIVAGTILESLVTKGLISCYEDENTEKVYFLTDEGKKLKEYVDQHDKKENNK